MTTPNNQAFTEVSGDFLDSCLELRLKTTIDPENIALLPPNIQRAYVHEHLHYLQNLTTTYGVLGTWAFFDRLYQLVNSVHDENGDVFIPLENSTAEEQMEIRKFLRAQDGYGELPKQIHPIVRDGYRIEQYELTEDPLIGKIVPQCADARHVDLTLIHSVGGECFYRFGARAIQEGMAFLLETKHYDVPNLPKYPYKVVKELAHFIHPPIAADDELLFALCEISLMHPLPAWAFTRLLEEMQSEEFASKGGEKILEYGYLKYKSWGLNIEQLRENAVTSIKKISGQIYRHPRYKATLDWLQLVFVRGHNLREHHTGVLLDIYKDKGPLGEAMTEAWINVGGPHCININNVRRIRLPEEMEGKEGDVYPQHLRVAKQLEEFLINGKKECSVYSICKASQPDKTDERCLTVPWERAKDTEFCPYVTAWHFLGLHGKRIVMKDGTVIQT